MSLPTRAEAWDLLSEWTTGEMLIRHALAVEGCVAWYGEHQFGITGRELETWRAAGLLHDYDYERAPESHPLGGAAELRRRGYDEDFIRVILGHGDHTGIPRTTLLARTVYACDEMSGFVIAVAYVRPHRSLDEVDARSVLRKMRDRGFARQVDRDQLERGAQEIQLPLEEHIEHIVAGLKTVRERLEL
jgi:predicted hydrolase (HD superfamily)